MAATASPPRDRRLDLLRGLAILLVLGVHQPVISWWARIGWSGVDLFFVLSGFLVSGLLFAEYRRHGGLRPWRFLIRRGFKIYPAFYFFIAVTVLAEALTRPAVAAAPEFWRALAAELLFVQNYVEWTMWNHTWSLAVEEHFYILLTLVLVLLSRRGDRAAQGGASVAAGTGGSVAATAAPFHPLPALIGAVLLLVILGRLATARLAPEFAFKTHFFPTHLRLDSLLFGVLLSYYRHFQPERFAGWLRRRGRLAAAAIVCLLLGFLFPQNHPLLYTFGLTALYLGFGALLLLALGATAAAHPNPAGWLTRPLGTALARIGFYSYSIYLWHMPVASWLKRLWAGAEPGLAAWFRNAPVAFALYVAAAIGLGMLMATVIELPFLRLRDRLFHSRSR